MFIPFGIQQKLATFPFGKQQEAQKRFAGFLSGKGECGSTSAEYLG
jgi:hypothetical protein